MSDTPETDAEVNELKSATTYNMVWAEFARKLERERDEAWEVLREIRDNELNPEDEADKFLRDHFDKFLRDHLPSELSKVREQRNAVTLRLGETQERMIDAERQRDRLAAVLQRIRDGYGGQVATPNCCEDCDFLIPIDEALATSNQPNL